MAQKKWKRNL